MKLKVGFTFIAAMVGQIFANGSSSISGTKKSLDTHSPLDLMNYILGAESMDTSPFSPTLKSIIEQQSALLAGSDERAALASVSKALEKFPGFTQALTEINADKESDKSKKCTAALGGIRGLDATGFGFDTSKSIMYYLADSTQLAGMMFNLAFRYLDEDGYADYKKAMGACLTAAGYDPSQYDAEFAAGVTEIVKVDSTPALDWTVLNNFANKYSVTAFSEEELKDYYISVKQMQWMFLYYAFTNVMIAMIPKANAADLDLINDLGFGTFASEAEWDAFMAAQWKDYMLERNMNSNQFEDIYYNNAKVATALGWDSSMHQAMAGVYFLIKTSTDQVRTEVNRARQVNTSARRRRSVLSRSKRDIADAASISTHGCWCPKLDSGVALHGQPVSTADSHCRAWSKCTRCLGCDPQPFFLVELLDDGRIVCDQQSDACTVKACECNLNWALDTVDFLSTNDLDPSLSNLDDTVCKANPGGHGATCP